MHLDFILISDQICIHRKNLEAVSITTNNSWKLATMQKVQENNIRIRQQSMVFCRKSHIANEKYVMVSGRSMET